MLCVNKKNIKGFLMKTDKIIEAIEVAEIGRNNPASPNDISKVRVALKMAKFPAMPDEYEKILMSFNGLSNDGPVLLGVEEGNNFFPNVAKYNKEFFKEFKADFLILGYDGFYYMIFDETDKKYKLVDQDDFGEIIVSEEIDGPLAYLLHIDLL